MPGSAGESRQDECGTGGTCRRTMWCWRGRDFLVDAISFLLLEHESGVVAWGSCALAVGDAEQADSHQKPRARRPDAWFHPPDALSLPNQLRMINQPKFVPREYFLLARLLLHARPAIALCMSTHPAPSFLFVCLGNICRSPLAEGALRDAARKAGLDLHVDSAGTADWHEGKAPDPRAIRTAQRHGVDIAGLRARQVQPADFERFTHIFALDADNLENLQRIAPSGHGAHLGLLMDLVDERAGQPVADPYYGDESGFDVTWSDVSIAAQAVLTHLSR
jgi:protein-tyrosine phosphatase